MSELTRSRPRALLALRTTAERVLELMRTLPDASTPIARSEWTVGDAAAHLVVGQRVYTALLAGEPSPVTSLRDLPAINARYLAEITERNPAALADLFQSAHTAFLTAIDRTSEGANVPWHAGQSVPLRVLIALAVGEFLSHGYDIATAIGRPWSIDPDDARIAIEGAMTVAPGFVDEAAARGFRGSYLLALRGGPRLTCQFDDGRLTVRPGSVGRIDCRINADPVAFFLVGYGRVSQWGPIFQGKLIAWGRKPWLGFRFASLLRNP